MADLWRLTGVGLTVNYLAAFRLSDEHGRDDSRTLQSPDVSKTSNQNGHREAT